MSEAFAFLLSDDAIPTLLAKEFDLILQVRSTQVSVHRMMKFGLTNVAWNLVMPTDHILN